MCGFIAAFEGSSRVPRETLSRALASLRHRGPDAAGEWAEGDVFLGHTRLSIIDLATGQQPMHSSDGRYVIVFNGEIYNFPQLRDTLAADGAVFQTRSDTEVILEGYRRWGKAVVEKLNGMFAFVIWDRQRRTAFAARDRLGIKPLCWAISNGTLYLTSTLEPFRVLGSFRQIDPVAVRDLLTFDYIPAPRTIRQGVHKLEPGCRFEWQPGMSDPVPERYWNPPAVNSRCEPPGEEELEDLLRRSVSRQMLSDVPIGAFLSGGIDSSLLVAFMAQASDTPVKTYSVAFGDPRFDESSIARRVAAEFGTDHCVIQAEDIDAAALKELIGTLDEPFCDTAFIPLYALSRLTRDHVKVALCGDGADELFGGYTKYLGLPASGSASIGSSMLPLLKGLPWRPRGVGRFYQQLLTSEQRVRYSYSRYGDFPVFRKDLRQVFSDEYVEAAQVEHFFEPWDRHAIGHENVSDLLMRTDLRTYLSENCLVKTDRASMLASLEVRVPYLDELLLDRVLPLGSGHKIVNGQLKALLQPLARRLLPREVWDRPKHGFNVPLEARLAGAWRPLVEEALAWGESHLNMFDYGYLRRLQSISHHDSDVGHELWNPLVLITWVMSQSPQSIRT